MHQKSFTSITHHTKSALELLHCDVWGPASVLSFEGYRYYLLIVDDFTRYTWIYPLKLKSDVAAIVPQFIKLVERQFQKKIKSFQSDMGVNLWCLVLYSGVLVLFTNIHVLTHINRMGW